MTATMERIIVTEGQLQRAVPPQQLRCAVVEGFVMNVYDARSKTSFMYCSTNKEPSDDFAKILQTVQRELPNTHLLRVYVMGNSIPDYLTDVIQQNLQGSGISINHLAPTQYFQLDFDPAKGAYVPDIKSTSASKLEDIATMRKNELN